MNESPTAEAAQASPAAIGGRRLTIGLYIAAAFLYWASLYLYVPTLPTYAQSKTESLALVGVILSMYGLWQAIIRLPLGIVADWLGRRKPFIIAGFVLAGLGAWAMGTAGNANGLLVGRAITGLAAGTWVPLVVVFSSLYPPEEAVQASAALTLVSSVARMLATSVTGSLNEWGGYPLAFFLATGAAGLAILAVLPARETRRPARLPSAAGIGSLVIRRDVLLPSLLNTVGQYAHWTTTFGFLPILAKQRGATDVTQSILVTLSIGMIIVGNLLATTIVRRIGARTMVYLYFVLIAAGVGVAALASDLWLIFVAQVCIGLSQGIGYPVLMGMSIQHVADAERATAMGLHQAVYAIGMFGGPWLSGILADAIGIQPMFGVTAAACLALGLFGTYWLSEGKEER